MPLFGNQNIEAGSFTMESLEKNVSKFTLPEAGILHTLHVYLDGLGPGVGDQLHRAVVYDDDGAAGDPGTLLGYTQLATVLDGSAGAWREFSVLERPTVVPNPHLDFDVTGYSTWQGVLTRDGAAFRSPPACGRLTASGTFTEAFASPGGDVGALRLGMVGGSTYTLSAWMRVPSGVGVALSDVGLILWDQVGAGGYQASVSASPSAFDTWLLISVTRTIRAGATEAFGRVQLNNVNSGEHILFDDVRLDAGTERKAEVWIPGGSYYLGLHSGDVHQTSQCRRAATANLTKTNNGIDTFTDGPSTAFGAVTNAVGPLSVYADYDLAPPVGRSLVTPYTVRARAGRSVVTPYLLRASVGRSLSTPYTVRVKATRSLVTPFTIRTKVGRSVVTPYELKLVAGTSLATPYTVSRAVAAILSMPYTVGAPPYVPPPVVIPGPIPPLKVDPYARLGRRLPTTLRISTLPRGARTVSSLAKHYYRSASRTAPIRKRNPILRSVGNHQDLVVYFEEQAHHAHLTITIPDPGVEVV